MQPANVDLNHIVPTVIPDGNAVVINEHGIATLIFFETRGQNENRINADVVASVRIGSVQDLENLQKSITDTIQQHKTREK